MSLSTQGVVMDGHGVYYVRCVLSTSLVQNKCRERSVFPETRTLLCMDICVGVCTFKSTFCLPHSVLIPLEATSFLYVQHGESLKC